MNMTVLLKTSKTVSSKLNEHSKSGVTFIPQRLNAASDNSFEAEKNLVLRMTSVVGASLKDDGNKSISKNFQRPHSSAALFAFEPGLNWLNECL